MAIAFVIFAAVSVGFFVVAVKWGVLRDLEQAKYYMLTIDEPDYYTQDWPKEEEHATGIDRPPSTQRVPANRSKPTITGFTASITRGSRCRRHRSTGGTSSGSSSSWAP